MFYTPVTLGSSEVYKFIFLNIHFWMDTISSILLKRKSHFVELLKTKTAGNLSEDEEHLLNQVLNDLRTKYLEKILVDALQKRS